MQYMTLQYSWEQVLIQGLLISIEAIHETMLLIHFSFKLFVSLLHKYINTEGEFIYPLTLDKDILDIFLLLFRTNQTFNLRHLLQFYINKGMTTKRRRERTLGCWLHKSPKFFNNLFLFVCLTTLGNWNFIGWFKKRNLT